MPLALDQQRVVVVPARAAQVGHRAAEVHRRDAARRRARSEQAEADREPVEDRVRHVLLAQLAAQPLGLLRGDLERCVGIARADVAAADVGQLDDSAVLLDEPGRAAVGDEVPQPAERVLEVRREQLLEAELGHELVRTQPSALVDRAQKAVSMTEVGRRDGTHRPRTLMERARPGDPGRAPADLSPRACRPPPWRPQAHSPRRPPSPPSAPARERPSWPPPSASPSTRRASTWPRRQASRRPATSRARASRARASSAAGFAGAEAGFARRRLRAAGLRRGRLGRRGRLRRRRLRRGRVLRRRLRLRCRGRLASSPAPPASAAAGFGAAGFFAAAFGFAVARGLRRGRASRAAGFGAAGFFAAAYGFLPSRRPSASGRRGPASASPCRRLRGRLGRIDACLGHLAAGGQLRAPDFAGAAGFAFAAAGFFFPVGTALRSGWRRQRWPSSPARPWVWLWPRAWPSPSAWPWRGASWSSTGRDSALGRGWRQRRSRSSRARDRPSRVRRARKAWPSACAWRRSPTWALRGRPEWALRRSRAPGWPPPPRRAAGGRRARRRPCGRGRRRCRSVSSVSEGIAALSLP